MQPARLSPPMLLAAAALALSSVAIVTAWGESKVTKVFSVPDATPAFLESPAYHAKENAVYFSDLIGDRILRFDRATSKVTTFRQPIGRANGLAFDSEGNLFICEGGNRRVTRLSPEGELTVVADRYDEG